MIADNMKAQFLVLLAFSVCFIPTGTSLFLDYGDPCSSSDAENICDPSIFLTCVEDTCRCNATMAWDVKDVARCSFKLSATCRLYPTPMGPFCYGTAVCVESAGNEYNGICTCLSPDEPSQNGEYCLHLAHEVGDYCSQDGVTCSPTDKLTCLLDSRCGCQEGYLANGTVCMAGVNATCKVGSDLPTETCRRNTLLKCNSETERCECTRGTEHVWNDESAICLTKIGATCEYEDDDHHACVDEEKSHCRTDGGVKMCTCNQYHHASPDGTECLQDPVENILSHGEDCDPDNLIEICNYSKDQLCSCPYDNFTCFCECDAGLLVNSRGDCEAGYNAPCSPLPNPMTNLTCNEEAFMTCHEYEGKFACGCDSPLTQAYDPLLKKCHLLVGQECDATHDENISCHPSSICRTTGGESTFCWCDQRFEPSLDQARCLYNYYNPTKELMHGEECEDWNYREFCPHDWNLFCLNGTCQCPEGGFLWNGQNQSEGCYPQYGMPCKINSGVNLTCDRQNKFFCNVDTCVCIFSHTWEEGSNRTGCFLRPGLECNATDVEPFPCVTNATCTSQPDKVSQCKCNSGYEPDPETYEQTCRVSGGHVHLAVFRLELLIVILLPTLGKTLLSFSISEQ